MQIQHNISLKNYNTFGIEVQAKQFVEITQAADIQPLLAKQENFFVLSGGSNILLTKDLDTLVIHLNSKGIETVRESDNTIELKVQAGENWHDFVCWCLERDYGGLENLSLIPGNVGTSPIQNIGAYGVEVKDLITEVEFLDIETNEFKTFSNHDCQFGYRNSIFKNNLKGKVIVTAVTFRLTKENHNMNTSYGSIEQELKIMNVSQPTIQDISDAVIAIRSSKLPNPKEIGNSGSFFKNPVIPKEKFDVIEVNYPEIPSYPVSEFEVKVPAGWLIEKAGFKGKRFGDAGVHKNQALVLVNYGAASGAEIHQLAVKIQEVISERFGIALEMEVNVI